jgi:hypothetical protein
MLKITRITWLFTGLVLAIGGLVGCGSETEPAAEQVDNTPAAEPQATAEPDDVVASEAAEGQEEPADEEPSEPAEQFDEPVEPPKLPPPEGAEAMPKPNRTWIDVDEGVVIVDGYVSVREGMLEMFACPVGTKEYESVVAVYSWAKVVHAALLAVGAETGSPVQFNPEFKPPTGTRIDIEVRWLDEAGQWQSVQAQDWIKDLATNQAMAHHWVFAGSGFWEDERTGETHYLADVGDFICVSNFSSATLDIPAESSQVTDGLMFEAFTEKIPPLGTPVRLVLKPRLEQANSKP